MHLECEGCIPVISSKCIDCKYEVEQMKIEEYQNVKSQIMKLVAEPIKDKSAYENLFNQAVGVFHPYDKDYVDLLKDCYFRQLADDNNEREHS